MAKTWVLQTETKGTGATMVPLERTEKRGSAREPVFVPRDPGPRDPTPEPAAPRPPRRFRVVDMMTRQTMLDDGPVAEAVDVLRNVRSTVDVTVHVWDEHRRRWRPLTLSEQRAMFDLSRDGGSPGPGGDARADRG
ncbi:MAG TPA: hypothetical protein VE571_10335 [Solirubrobacteraceae bacterium]|nr:hypothetical protein [Solirubrobacteraceae bacterium]